MRPLTLCVAAAALLQAGCTSMSGLSGSSSYSCKAPVGVQCDSVAGTYTNAVQHNLPSQRTRAVPAHETDEPTAQPPRPVLTVGSPPAPSVRGPGTSLPPTPITLRSTPRVLRLWFKAWEDADHDLYDQGYVYVQVDGGRWQIEHVQRQIRESYAPIRAPQRSAEASGSALPPNAAAELPGRPRPGTGPLPSGMPKVLGAEPRAEPARSAGTDASND